MNSPPNFFHRGIALLVLAVQAAALYWMAHVVVFPVAAMAIAFALCVGDWRVSMSRRAQLLLYLALAIGFAAKGFWLPLGDLERPAFHIGYPRSYAIAQFLVVVQILMFPLSKDGWLRPALPFYGAVVLMFAGNVQSNGELDVGFRILTLLYVATAAMYCVSFVKPGRGRARRIDRLRWIAAAAALVFAAELSWGTSAFLEAIESRVEQFVFNLHLGRSGDAPGFPGRSRIGSVAERKETDGQEVALRVYSDVAEAPGYFRAKTYADYRNSVWSCTSASETRTPADAVPSGIPAPIGDRNVFAIVTAENASATTGTAARHRMRVLSSSTCGTSVFTSRESRYVETRADSLAVADDQTVEAATRVPAADYTIYEGNTPRADPLPSNRRDAFLALDEALDPRIRDLARRVVPDGATPRVKAAAIESYFHTHYKYHIGIEVPRGMDPMVYFLTEKPPAHCEYFATAATVLLRLSGVPCRYVTGFVVREENALGDYWVARNKDSHAWVEAWDDATGWFVVEATPAAGVPQIAKDGAIAQVWDYMKSRFQRVMAFLKSGWPAIAAWLGGIVVGVAGFFMRSALGWTILVVVAAVIGIRLCRKWNAKRRGGKVDPILAAGNRLLAEVEETLRGLGWMRSPHETLHQFARRLEDAGDTGAGEGLGVFVRAAAFWMRDYAAWRYGAKREESEIRTLGERLPRASAVGVRRNSRRRG